jgi:hypothetical protein
MLANGQRRTSKLQLAELRVRHHLIFDTYEEKRVGRKAYLG